MRQDILEYLWRRFPHHCIVLTDADTYSVIDLGIARAATHGFRKAEDVCSWIVLMIYFGSYFDEDLQYPWAALALKEAQGLDRTAAMQRLFAHMNEATDAMLGENGVNYRKALSFVGKLDFDVILRDQKGDLQQSLRRWMHVVFPEKSAVLSEECKVVVTASAAKWAEKYGLGERCGAIVSLLFLLLSGSRSDQDPIRPWISGSLTATGVADPEAKTRLVYETLRSTLRRFAKLDRFRDAETEA